MKKFYLALALLSIVFVSCKKCTVCSKTLEDTSVVETDEMCESKDKIAEIEENFASQGYSCKKSK